MRRRGPWSLLFLLLIAGCGRPPQLGADEASFKAVDALYTAVGLRDVAALDRSAATLDGLRAAGKLPDAAADALTRVVAEAKSGAWESAQTRLGTFMEGQRR